MGFIPPPTLWSIITSQFLQGSSGCLHNFLVCLTNTIILHDIFVDLQRFYLFSAGVRVSLFARASFAAVAACICPYVLIISNTCPPTSSISCASRRRFCSLSLSTIGERGECLMSRLKPSTFCCCLSVSRTVIVLSEAPYA